MTPIDIIDNEVVIVVEVLTPDSPFGGVVITGVIDTPIQVVFDVHSGPPGASGISGYSGHSGNIGSSGLSGYSGPVGAGSSGFSGYSGYSGSGISGYSGYSAYSGYSGVTPSIRVLTITSSATPTINTDLYDAVTITALATAITSMTTNLSGTPTNFQKLIIRIKDDGTARAITWGASFVSSQSTLPTTTVISKVTTVGLIWDSVKTSWVCLAVDQEP